MSQTFVDELHFDYETRSEVDLPNAGLARYVMDKSTEATLCSWHLKSWGNDVAPKLWDYNYDPFPVELKDAIEARDVKKVAWNAQFERNVSKHVLGFDTGYNDWQCGMVQAYCLSFIGGLGDVAKQIDAPIEKQKLDDGKRLIKLFSMPQKVTKNQPYRWRDILTDPDDWELFREYCVQDTVTEMDMWRKFSRYPIGDNEWDVYAFDQKVNDRGYPLDLTFCRNAVRMVEMRKAEIKAEMQALTGLANPNSPVQLLPWLQRHGYPFKDLQKNTVKKALANFADDMDEDAIKVARLRRWAASTAASKYTTYLKREVNGRYMHGLQMAGAQRTRRWGGRGAQPQNQSRTPGYLEDREFAEGYESEVHGTTLLDVATELVRENDYEALKLFSKEPMEILAGCVRSAIRAPEGRELRVTDLASVESIGVGYVSHCDNILDIFRSGKDLYRTFGTYMFNKPYEEISKQERGYSKPPTLGGGFGLGGGQLNEEGERTGLWAYAESMGIDMTKEMAHESVRIFRNDFAPEVASMWGELDEAVFLTLRDHKPRTVRHFRFEYMKPFLLMWLPSGRPIFYYKPRIVKTIRERVNFRTGKKEKYEKDSFVYKGKSKVGNNWVDVYSWGGKLIENGVQAYCRDVLVEKLLALDKRGFNFVLHVHDEGVGEEDIDDDVHTLAEMDAEFARSPSFALDMPLGSAGYVNPFYKKD